MHPPTTAPTALVLIDLQRGLTHPTHFGTTRSTPTLESNIQLLLSTVRTYNSSVALPSFRSSLNNNSDPSISVHHSITIIHIHHHSLSPTSPLYPSALTSWLPNSDIQGITPLTCATPTGSETVIIKSTNSAFIGTDLETRLRNAGIRQIIVVGLTTEHCVSSTVRMAANLNVVGDPEGRGERGVVLVTDGCAAFGKGGGGGSRRFEAEVVHGVEIECLRGEFAECLEMREVVRCIRGDVVDGNWDGDGDRNGDKDDNVNVKESEMK